MESVRTILIRGAILAACLALVWLLTARPLSLWVDRFARVREVTLPTGPLQYDGGGFRIGELQMTIAGMDNQRYDLQLSTDSSNRLAMTAHGKSFVFGPRLSPPDPAGRPEIDFAPDPDDQLSFTFERSWMSWPTPFEFNLAGGRSPSWRRHLYYRFASKKRSGATLEMLWRYEQQYYRGLGWTSPAMNYNFSTGLLKVEVHAPGL